jgi:Flp pilus assembly protein TadG
MVKIRARRDVKGAAAVEFALVMIPFLALVIGLIEYGWFFYVAQNTSGATTTLARKLEVGDCWNSGQPLTFAQAQSAQVTAVSVNPAASGTIPAQGSTYTVTVTANAKILNFLPVPSGGTITRTVTAQVEDTTAATC